MEQYAKALRVLAKAFRFCWKYIILNIAIVFFSTSVGLLMNYINSKIIAQLTYDTLQGQLSIMFYGMIFAYMTLYWFQKTSGFLGAIGYNFYQSKVDQVFQDVFNWKSYVSNQEDYYNADFVEDYAFAQKGIGKISTYINNITHLLFSNFTTLITSVVIFIKYEPVLVFFLLIVFVISCFLNKFMADEEYKLDKKQLKEQRYNNYYKGLLVDKKNAKELRIYKTQKHFFGIWANYSEKLRKEKLELSLKKSKLKNINATVKIGIRALSVALLLIGIYNKDRDVATFLLLLGFINTSVAGIDSLSQSIVSGTYKDVKYIAAYYDFIMPISDKEIISICGNKVDKDNKGSCIPFGSFEELKVNNVSYTYPTGQVKAVDDVSMTLKKGEIISILGYNGSGKTTLSKLICGALFPQEGTISINGTEINEKNKYLAHQYFGVAPQEYSRFSVSIKDFINLQNSSFDGTTDMRLYDEPLIRELIDKYPDGEETLLGKVYSSQGIDLSGGEWQLLNITSAYTGTPEILILDEPTASIDPLREERLIESIRNSLNDKTAILITHRLSFARIADWIVMMKDGKITEQGTHSELLSLKGEYYQIFTQQQQLYL